MIVPHEPELRELKQYPQEGVSTSSPGEPWNMVKQHHGRYEYELE
jgi:hypothetical protein